MTQTFLLDFITQIKQAYEAEPPGRVFSVIDKPDLSNKWLILQFNIDHPRKVDEIGIRWSDMELTVDFLPASALAVPICFIDNRGLRWITLDYFKSCQVLNKKEKADIERILTNIYAIAQYYKPYLRFVLKNSSVLKSKEKKV